MKRIQLLIQKVLEDTDPNLPLAERKKLEEALVHVFSENQTPQEALGFSEEMMEHLYAYGYRFYNNGNYKKADDVFLALTVYNPKESRFFLARGASLHRLKNYREACEYYLAASILNQQDPLPFYYMFDCYNQAGMLSDAEACLLIALQRMGDNPVFNKLKERCSLMLESLKVYMADLENRGELVYTEEMFAENPVSPEEQKAEVKPEKLEEIKKR